MPSLVVRIRASPYQLQSRAMSVAQLRHNLWWACMNLTQVYGRLLTHPVHIDSHRRRTSSCPSRSSYWLEHCRCLSVVAVGNHNRGQLNFDPRSMNWSCRVYMYVYICFMGTQRYWEKMKQKVSQVRYNVFSEVSLSDKALNVATAGALSQNKPNLIPVFVNPVAIVCRWFFSTCLAFAKNVKKQRKIAMDALNEMDRNLFLPDILITWNLIA